MKRQSALSLVELIVVIAILGILAVAAIPELTSPDPVKLELAAAEVAAALRFARSESVRTRDAHGVMVDHDDTDSSGRDILVYKVDLDASPFGIERVLYHPVRKQPYDLRIGDDPGMRGVSITNGIEAFKMDAVGTSKHIHFDAAGRPVYYRDKTPLRLLGGGVRLGNGREERVVSVEPVTGRVVIQ